MDKRGSIQYVVAALLLLFTPSFGRAASVKFCDAYAQLALEQHQLNLQRGCGFSGARWSDDRNGHAAWCRSLPMEAADAETLARMISLSVSCPAGQGQASPLPNPSADSCASYATEAVSQDRINRSHQCGFTDPRWSNAFDNHRSWCLDASTGAVEYERLARVEALDTICGLSPRVEQGMPNRDLFIGEYARIPLRLQPYGSGLTIPDLEYSVREGSAGGIVSLSKSRQEAVDTPYVILLAGHRPGTYTLEARERDTGRLIGEGRFTISPLWGNDARGPSWWTSASLDDGFSGAAWGGGNGSLAPVYKPTPAKGESRVAVLLVDTKDQRFDKTAVTQFITDWNNATEDGEVFNGQTRTTQQYFTEASDNQLQMDFDVYGPVELPGGWSEYFSGSSYKGNLWQQCATAGDVLIDFSSVDKLVCVTQPIITSTARQSAWPSAGDATVKVDEGTVAVGTVSMPVDWNRNGLVPTLSHELTHTFGLGDIYSYSGHPIQYQRRQLGGWAIMADESNLPRPILVHRLGLGWSDSDRVKVYDFQKLGEVDELVTLVPPWSTQGNAGLEIPIALGLSYFCEYRVAGTAQVSDQGLPINDRVVCTEVTFDEQLVNGASRRKPVMLLSNDGKGDGPVLGPGGDYRERDTSDPQNPMELRLSVDRIDSGQAVVRVQYHRAASASASQRSRNLDLSIRPWSHANWQSPDIRVRNKKSDVDNSWLNVPWSNHINRIEADIRNSGNLDAQSVWVKFSVKDYTLNGHGTLKQLIDRVPIDIPAGKTVTATTEWTPTDDRHVCLVVEIEPYQDPNGIAEKLESNNIAQSNYTRFISAISSPGSRERLQFSVHNPLDQTTDVQIQLQRHANPLYRTYLEHKWLRLRPGETRWVQAMFEYLGSDAPGFDDPLESYLWKDNQVSLRATARVPDAGPEAPSMLLGGGAISIGTGRKVEFSRFDADPGGSGTTFVGSVVTADGSGAPSGKVLISVSRGKGETLREQYGVVKVDHDGKFYLSMEGDHHGQVARADFLGDNTYANAQSETVVVP